MDDELKDSADHIFYDSNHHIRKRWKARLVVCGIMLVLAIICLILAVVKSGGFWLFSQALSAIYAILSIWLFWYLNRGQHRFTTSTFWHQIFHWLGLLVALYLVHVFVQADIVSPLNAGVLTITILALTIYLIGVYSDVTFIFIGIVLAIFAYCLAYVEVYLYIVVIPAIIIAAIIIFIIVHREKRKADDSA